MLRRLEALLIVADREKMLLLSGTGDVIEPDGDAAAVGSGGPYALAAARALLGATELPAREIVERALAIAGEICIYTNAKHVRGAVAMSQRRSRQSARPSTALRRSSARRT